MYVLTKVERCVYGPEPDQFLDVPYVIGVFESVGVAKKSIDVTWPVVNTWTDIDNRVSNQEVVPDSERKRDTYQVHTYWYEIHKYVLNTLINE